MAVTITCMKIVSDFRFSRGYHARLMHMYVGHPIKNETFSLSH